MPSFASPQIDALLEHIPINETRDVLWLHLLSHVLFGKLAFLESWPFWKAGLFGKLAFLESWPFWKAGLFGKPVPTVPGHALMASCRADHGRTPSVKRKCDHR
jgi:hypothetical protein